MLDELLEKWGFETYNDFADFLGVHRQTFWRYRVGEREFRLNWQQVLKLNKLLKQIGKDIEDLPLDWYLDPNQREHL
ncbi:hypothetical protein [Gloeothece verrucosa]|uniref:XRE family transcriptional regulator n=1 Tax=Gloeothece verrucosa (strain PCC 7822) TaxID=497965 RepID=E0U7U8_GLOV7|nr:hypothetical protein [Gloeothece verrucosa]ADN16035.1 hypothetical protein Cyan7822_4115 [Gloeothece verrucosa PCC 7822]